MYSVLNQIKFMEELPDRIKVMTARITSDYTLVSFTPLSPSSLKVVYDEWLGYYAWMWKIKDQIATINDPSRKSLTEEIYQDCFTSITSLQTVLEEKLWEHIYRCIEIAQIDPAALVRGPSSRRTSAARTKRSAWRSAGSRWCRGSSTTATGWTSARIVFSPPSSVAASERTA